MTVKLQSEIKNTLKSSKCKKLSIIKIDNNLNFKEHTESLFKKASEQINTLYDGMCLSNFSVLLKDLIRTSYFTRERCISQLGVVIQIRTSQLILRFSISQYILIKSRTFYLTLGHPSQHQDHLLLIIIPYLTLGRPIIYQDIRMSFFH